MVPTEFGRYRESTIAYINSTLGADRAIDICTGREVWRSTSSAPWWGEHFIDEYFRKKTASYKLQEFMIQVSQTEIYVCLRAKKSVV